jgi:hypothetical protein
MADNKKTFNKIEKIVVLLIILASTFFHLEEVFAITCSEAGGTCYAYYCPSGYTQISGTCNKPDWVCCRVATTTSAATFTVKSCLKVPDICDLSQYRTCPDLVSSVKVTYVDQYGIIRTETRTTPFDVIGMKDGTKTITLDFQGKPGYVFHSWNQVDENGNGYCGGSNPFTDTQALGRTFVVFLERQTTTTSTTTTTLPSGLSTTCSGRTTSQDAATISPTTNWQTISGSLSSSTDTKRYKITVTSPGQHEFSLCSADGGSANYDSYICIFDSSGNLIASNDDYCNRQSKITFSFSSTGTYYIQISGYSSNYGSYTLAYRKTPVTTTVTTTTYTTTSLPAVTTTTIPPCPYTCLDSAYQCNSIGGTCVSGYYCSYGCCCRPRTTTTTRTTTVTTTTTTITTTTIYNFDFDISLYPTSDRIIPSEFSLLSVSIRLRSGETQNVRFSCSDLPPGVSCYFEPVSCSPPCSSSLKISTSPTTPLGTYSITIEGNGGGIRRTAVYTLTVATCMKYPSISITPPNPRELAGSTLTYTVSVTNNDEVACGESTFRLNVANCPSDWTCSLSKSSITISPGSTDSSTQIYVTSPSTATPGTYTFEVAVHNLNATKYWRVGEGKYTVITSATDKCKPLIIKGDPSEKIDIVFVNERSIPNHLNAFHHYYSIMNFNPFNKYSDKFNLWYLDEELNFECSTQPAPGGGEEWKCNENKILSKVYENCPADQIIAEIGHPFAYLVRVYARPELNLMFTFFKGGDPWTPNLVTIHEFAHSFGKLMDEYSYGIDSPQGVKPWGPNCADIPSESPNIPCPKWSDVPEGCYRECTYNNFYRPTECSIMRSFLPWCQYFNQVSVRQLERCINQGCIGEWGTQAMVNPLKNEPRSELVYFLLLHYKDGKVYPKNISLKKGFPSIKTIQPTIAPKIELLSKYDEVLYSANIEVPDKTIFEVFDTEKGEIRGFIDVQKEFDFLVTVPYFPNLKSMNFYSEENMKTQMVDVSRFDKERIAVTTDVCQSGKICSSNVIGECNNGIWIVKNHNDSKALQTPKIGFIPGIIEYTPVNSGKIDILSICFEPQIKFIKTILDVSPYTPNLLVSHSDCYVNSLCTSEIVSSCSDPMWILLNSEGRPLDYTREFPIRYEIKTSYTPTSTGKIKAMAICFSSPEYPYPRVNTSFVAVKP